MFSIADMAVAGAVALLLFGPDQLPKVARRAGQLVRDVQNTSQSFIREMERAADASEEHDTARAHSSAASALPAAPAYHETPEPAAHDLLGTTAAEAHRAVGDIPAPEPAHVAPSHTEAPLPPG